MKYIVYATAKDGQGHVQKIGTYDDVENIILNVGMFSDDVVLTIDSLNDDTVDDTQE